MIANPNLFAQQEANRRRSRWLVIGFILFFAWLGFGGDFIAYLYTRGGPPGTYHHVVPVFGILLTLIGSAIAAWSWRTGPKRVLWSTGARELTEPGTLEERQLDNVVQEMAIAAGIPRPRIWIIEDPDPNAFATGHDEGTANIAVTRGLLAMCSRDELQGVIAHEMGHVKNLDVRLTTLLAALVGAVALASNGMGRMIFYGGYSPGGMRMSGRGGSRSSNDDRGGGSGPLLVILLVVWVVSWLLAPLVTRLLALGVSRDREYLADAMSAQFTRNPLALAEALQKIESADAPTRSIKSGAAHLCIADPLGRQLNHGESRFANLFGTHPPMAKRIARLEAMAYGSLPASSSVAPPPAPAPNQVSNRR